MKRFLVAIVSLVLLISILSSASAETPETILFRNIPWFESYATVKQRTDSIDGASKSWYKGIDEGARIEGWYRQWSNMYANENVTNGGTILNYDNVAVAGYNSSLQVSFIYPIENNKIKYETEASKFYKAKYKIDDLEDIEGAYSDLVTKLSTLYGTPEDKSYYNTMDKKDSPKGSVWYAKDGSTVWIGIYYNSFKDKYDELSLVYAAPGTNELLIALDEQMKQEAADEEAAQRENNSSNFDGL